MVDIRRKEILVKIFVFGIFFAYFSNAYPGAYPSAEEIKYLPRYCQARLGQGSKSEAAMWKKRFGRGVWTGFHHYCQQINYQNRYYKTLNPEVRDGLLQNVVDGMKGQLEAYGPSFILRHDAYYRMGWAQAKLGRTAPAFTSFRTAIKIKPKFAKAYAALSDLYRDLGQLNDALETINLGIKNIPKSKGLKRRKKELEKRISK